MRACQSKQASLSLNLELIRREIPVFVCFVQWYEIARVGIRGLVGATCRRAWYSCLSSTGSSTTTPCSLPLSLPSIPLIPASVAVAGRSGLLTATTTSFSLPKVTIPISGGSGGTDTGTPSPPRSNSHRASPLCRLSWSNGSKPWNLSR